MAVLQKTTTRVSVVIVHYKTDELTLKLLSGLPKQTGAEVIVVDNSPEPTLKSVIKAKHPHVSYIFAGKNLGFAGGNNLGIKSARGEWVCILNSDTVTSWDSLFSLIDTAEKHSYLLAAPLLQNKGMIEHNVGYFDTVLKHPVNGLLARPRMIDTSVITRETAVNIATGAALLVHTSVFEKIGFLDDQHYFMYFEDIDFCYRLHKAGIPILYVPQVRITHYGGASSDKDPAKKNDNYLKGLDAYLTKHRGSLVRSINARLKLFQ